MSVETILRRAEIFDELTTTQLELVGSICEERDFQTGDIIFSENTPGQELYVIADGEVEIQVDPSLVGDKPGAGLKTIARLRRDQSFGEVALVDEGKRSATALCVEHDTHVIVIPRDKLMGLCESNPQLGYLLMRNLAADLAMKIRHTDLQVREQLYWAHNVDKTQD